MESNTFKLSEFTSFKEVVGQYENSFIRNSLALKIEESDNEVSVVMASSKVDSVLPVLKNFHFPKEIKLIEVADSEFAEFIGTVLDTDAGKDVLVKNDSNEFKLDQVSDSSQVINIINSICIEAIRKGVSDIHIQCFDTGVLVRFRIDGVIHTVRRLSKEFSEQISSRIKVMSGLNIMETRLPQDGRMTVRVDGFSTDFRVSFIPVTHGESIVLRIFDKNKKRLSLDELGFNDRVLRILKNIKDLPNGVILVTGPTGSGKTTTLHSILNDMDKESLKIITIEDPVEKELEGIDQIQVNESIGLTFSNILRRVLRQDPDVIMVGEIRDTETAELVIRAALTGHIILSTLHTNDSISIITRLRNMGIEPYLISSVLRYGIAQRLVRRICSNCCYDVDPPDALVSLDKERFKGIKTIKMSKGCPECNFTGFTGRFAVSEVYKVTEDIERAIEESQSLSVIQEKISADGFVSLKDDAINAVIEGKTTYSEIKREGLV